MIVTIKSVYFMGQNNQALRVFIKVQKDLILFFLIKGSMEKGFTSLKMLHIATDTPIHMEIKFLVCFSQMYFLEK